MRLASIGIALVFTVVAMPAFAQEVPSFGSCDASAIQKGIGEGSAAYKRFMMTCLSDPPSGVIAAAALRITKSWDECEQLAMARGVVVNERRSTPGYRSPWKQFMDACMEGQVH
jgi:hypothetical protein